MARGRASMFSEFRKRGSVVEGPILLGDHPRHEIRTSAWLSKNFAEPLINRTYLDGDLSLLRIVWTGMPLPNCSETGRRQEIRSGHGSASFYYVLHMVYSKFRERS